MPDIIEDDFDWNYFGSWVKLDLKSFFGKVS